MPPGSTIAADEIARLTARAHDDLAGRLGVSIAPITVRLYPTLDAFRLATNRPWWVSAVAEGTAVDLAPLAVLTQRGGLAEIGRAHV